MVFMADHALLIAHSLVIEYLPHFMRLMAFNTNRNLVWFGFPKFTLNHSLMNFLNQTMTLAAGVCHIIPMDGRFRICVVADIVARVTTGANRRGDEAFFIQTASVNGLRIMRQNTVLDGSGSLVNGSSFTVATAAS